MNYEQEYNKIPLAILLNAGFPTNAVWLNDDQRRLLEYIFDEYYKELHAELESCDEEIEECCE
tara:strand:+ start:406 stop:594 length:189 start_codon:yes stop_codon:yes gene_type:complete